MFLSGNGSRMGCELRVEGLNGLKDRGGLGLLLASKGSRSCFVLLDFQGRTNLLQGVASFHMVKCRLVFVLWVVRCCSVD